MADMNQSTLCFEHESSVPYEINVFLSLQQCVLPIAACKFLFIATTSTGPSVVLRPSNAWVLLITLS